MEGGLSPPYFFVRQRQQVDFVKFPRKHRVIDVGMKSEMERSDSRR